VIDRFEFVEMICQQSHPNEQKEGGVMNLLAQYIRLYIIGAL